MRKENTSLCLRGHQSTVYSVAFAQNGEVIVPGSADRTVRAWIRSEGRTVTLFRTPGAALTMMGASISKEMVDAELTGIAEQQNRHRV
jgi:WD40 repeat protein